MFQKCLLAEHQRPAIRGTGGYGMSLPAAHGSLILATRITLPHFSVSSEINLPKSAGEPASTVPPKLASFVSRLASAMLTLTAVFSFSMTSAGVFFGAPMPAHQLAS